MTSHSRRAFLQGSLSALALGALAACSNDSDSGSAADSQDFSGTGPINYAQGKDFSSGMVQKRLDEWNRKYPDEKVTLIELSSEADQQRSSLVNSA
ncbi:MAG: ABC transporter substrate-binding protein, partial [Cutibacterium granulosum]